MVGWYHSHPGYGCWLSGIDVGTQNIQQQYQEPFLAIVVDPHRTIAAGKVEIGAFRTYPEVCLPYTRLNILRLAGCCERADNALCTCTYMEPGKNFRCLMHGRGHLLRSSVVPS
jgi:hypothetical protein